MSNAPTSILDRLRARKGETHAAPPPPAASAAPAAPPPAPAPAAPPAGGSVIERLRRASAVETGRTQSAEPNPGPVMVRTAFGDSPVEPGNAPAEGQTIVEPGQINPPEQSAPITAADLEAQKAAAKPAPAPASDGTRFRRTKDEIAAGLTVEQAKAARAPKSEPGDIAAAKGAIDALSAARAEEPAPAPEAPKSDEVAAPAGSPVPVVKPAKPIPVLFVNCAPVAGTYVLASHLASKANARICEDQKIADYRYIQYGAGPGCLRAAVMEMIDGADNCPPIMVDTSTPEGSILATDLEARAAQIVRGAR